MPAAADKPLDLGNGSVCASFDHATAAWLSIGRPHERHGFVELSAVPPFDERNRGNRPATRRHRVAMTLGEHAFLWLEIDGERPHLIPDMSEAIGASWSGADVNVHAHADRGGSAIRQTWSIRAVAARPRSVRLVLRGVLDRPALAEITELDPPAPTDARTVRRVHRDVVAFEAPALPARCEVAISPAVSWDETSGALVATVRWPAEAAELELSVELRMDGPPRALEQPGARHADEHDLLTRRTLTYIRGCTALSVASDERVILTDHRILPLSWTRDAYWQALALLAANGPSDRTSVADHLRWLWRRCERPDGRWVRSHHANGRRKDLAFQADQQLYPLVELADYWRFHRELPDGVDWNAAVPRAWAAALEEIDPATGMIGCAENAADDPAVAPFIGASQILLWYAALRLAELAEHRDMSMDATALRRTAVAAHESFDARLASGDGPWAYAVDVDGARINYHDANDLPVALAPIWGFCAPGDAGWRSTMEFAFSAANPGWFDGDRPGLGSAHTAGPWALGDIQAWLVGRATRDAAAQADAVRRLEEVSFSDGMLPEAYSADRNDDRRIRHWFAWPGAALAALRLLDRDGRLEERLSATPAR